jgi:hypothetical protein
MRLQNTNSRVCENTSAAVVSPHTKKGSTAHKKKNRNWKSVEERPKGEPRIRWEDQINEDTRRIGIEGWRSKIHDRKTWAKPGNTAEYRGRAQE